MKTTIRVLFVCLGNICRSPLAEAIFKHKVSRLGLEDRIHADSCGTSDYHIGQRPDSRTLKNAEKNGVTIDHVGRQLQEDDIHRYDIILAMDKSNHKDILRVIAVDEHRHKVHLMRKFDPAGGEEVPDPYYGGEQGFQQVFEILDRSMNVFIEHLRRDHLKE